MDETAPKSSHGATISIVVLFLLFFVTIGLLVFLYMNLQKLQKKVSDLSSSSSNPSSPSSSHGCCSSNSFSVTSDSVTVSSGTTASAVTATLSDGSTQTVSVTDNSSSTLTALGNVTEIDLYLQLTSFTVPTNQTVTGVSFALPASYRPYISSVPVLANVTENGVAAGQSVPAGTVFGSLQYDASNQVVIVSFGDVSLNDAVYLDDYHHFPLYRILEWISSIR